MLLGTVYYAAVKGVTPFYQYRWLSVHISLEGVLNFADNWAFFIPLVNFLHFPHKTGELLAVTHLWLIIKQFCLLRQRFSANYVELLFWYRSLYFLSGVSIAVISIDVFRQHSVALRIRRNRPWSFTTFISRMFLFLEWIFWVHHNELLPYLFFCLLRQKFTKNPN